MREKNENKKLTSKQSSPITFTPLLVAVTLYIIEYFWFLPFIAKNSFSDDWVLLLMISVTLRIIIGMWTVSLTEKYRLNQTLWVFLGFAFGLSQLIVINFAIWLRPYSDAKPLISEDLNK